MEAKTSYDLPHASWKSRKCHWCNSGPRRPENQENWWHKSRSKGRKRLMSYIHNQAKRKNPPFLHFLLYSYLQWTGWMMPARIGEGKALSSSTVQMLFSCTESPSQIHSEIMFNQLSDHPTHSCLVEHIKLTITSPHEAGGRSLYPGISHSEGGNCLWAGNPTLSKATLLGQGSLWERPDWSSPPPTLSAVEGLTRWSWMGGSGWWVYHDICCIYLVEVKSAFHPLMVNISLVQQFLDFPKLPRTFTETNYYSTTYLETWVPKRLQHGHFQTGSPKAHEQWFHLVNTVIFAFAKKFWASQMRVSLLTTFSCLLDIQ